MFHRFNQFLDALWPTTCIACDEPSDLKTFCQYCEPMIEPVGPEAVFKFSGPIQKVIQQAKFSPNESKAKQLMSYVHQLETDFPKAGEFDGIVFVPVHWRRRLSRGFDLSALFAVTLSKRLHLPIYDWLRNTRFEKPLTLTTSRANRIASIQGRYTLRVTCLSNKKLLLVDDVVTTGTTLDTCKQVLSNAGHTVTCYALAKTPWQK